MTKKKIEQGFGEVKSKRVYMTFTYFFTTYFCCFTKRYSTSKMTICSPYIYSWCLKNDKKYKISSLRDVKEKTCFDYVMLAFLTNETYNEIEQWIPEIRQFPGNVILSIGGADGHYPSVKLNVIEEFKELDTLIAAAGFKGLDLDIEGKALTDQYRLSKLLEIIKMISIKYGPNFWISITLPVEYEIGIGDDAAKVLKLFNDAKIRIKYINLMIMDFYTDLGHYRTWEEHNFKIIHESNTILQKIFGKTKKDVWKMMGLCPMIGQNDDGIIFTLEDWRHMVSFAFQMKIGLLTFWALNRDQIIHKKPHLFAKFRTDLNLYSYAQASDFAFTDEITRKLTGP